MHGLSHSNQLNSSNSGPVDTSSSTSSITSFQSLISVDIDNSIDMSTKLNPANLERIYKLKPQEFNEEIKLYDVDETRTIMSYITDRARQEAEQEKKAKAAAEKEREKKLREDKKNQDLLKRQEGSSNISSPRMNNETAVSSSSSNVNAAVAADTFRNAKSSKSSASLFRGAEDVDYDLEEDKANYDKEVSKRIADGYGKYAGLDENNKLTVILPRYVEDLEEFCHTDWSKVKGFMDIVNYDYEHAVDPEFLADIDNSLTVLNNMIKGASAERVLCEFLKSLYGYNSYRTYKHVMIAAIAAAMGNRQSMMPFTKNAIVRKFSRGTMFIIGSKDKITLNFSAWSILGHMFIAAFPESKLIKFVQERLGGKNIWHTDAITSGTDMRIKLLTAFKKKHEMEAHQLAAYTSTIIAIGKILKNMSDSDPVSAAEEARALKNSQISIQDLESEI